MSSQHDQRSSKKTIRLHCGRFLVRSLRPEDATERGLWMQEYIARVLRIVQQEAEHMAAAPNTDLASEEVADEVAKDEPQAPR